MTSDAEGGVEQGLRNLLGSPLSPVFKEKGKAKVKKKFKLTDIQSAWASDEG